MLADHITRNDFCAENRALEISPDDLVPIRRFCTHQKMIGSDAGIVDENINFLMAVNDFLRGRLDLAFLRDVELAKLAAPSRGLDRSQRLLRGRLIATIVNDHIRPDTGESQSTGSADAAASAGYQGNLTRETHWLHAKITLDKSCGASKFSSSILG